MAKKFVRGVTGVDDIETYDKTLTNVNDLISDGQNTYVHTKKGKNEFYYKVTDGVTSVNSTGGTITVEKSDDGTANLNTNPQKVLEHDNLIAGDGLTKVKSGDTTTLNVNTQKVLEHDNLLVDYGISKKTSGNTTNLGVEYTRVDGKHLDLNTLVNGKVRANDFINAPSTGWLFVSTYSEGSYTIQRAVKLVDNNVSYVRRKDSGVWREWREQVGDKSVIDGLLSQKQNKLTTGDGLAMVGDTITLKTFNTYNENLNNLTYSCVAKPVTNTPNLPSGDGGHGILTCLRVDDVVIQKYHPLSADKLYIRRCRGLPNSPSWTDWTLLS